MLYRCSVVINENKCVRKKKSESMYACLYVFLPFKEVLLWDWLINRAVSSAADFCLRFFDRASWFAVIIWALALLFCCFFIKSVRCLNKPVSVIHLKYINTYLTNISVLQHWKASLYISIKENNIQTKTDEFSAG